jgi:type IV pilus assembly protein PilO
MKNLRQTRRTLQLVMAILIGINVFLVAALAFFLVRGNNALEEEFQALHQQVVERKASVVPPQTVENRVKEAREQIAHFYEDRFPNSSAAIFENLGKLATENHVRLNQANYAQVADIENPAPGLRQVAITANLNGDYAQAMKFINALERDKMFFTVDSVVLGGDNTGGQVRLNIRIATFMREGA